MSGRVLAIVTIIVYASVLQALTQEQKASVEKIYTKSELVNMAELIGIAEVKSAEPNGKIELVFTRIMKYPPREVMVSWIDPKLLDRAAALLADNAQKTSKSDDTAPAVASSEKVQPATHDQNRPPVVVQLAQGLPVPKFGSQAIYLLWHRASGSVSRPLQYRLNHPQSLYELSYLHEIELAMHNRHRRSGADYIRSWDKQTADKLGLVAQNNEIKMMPAFNIEKGLQLSLLATRRSIKNDNTFTVTVKFINNRPVPWPIYDGLFNTYGVRLKKAKSETEETIVLRHKQQTDGIVDNETLKLADLTDFATVPAANEPNELTRQIHFEAKDNPILMTLEGEFIVNAFYMSFEDGASVRDLTTKAWTGCLVSDNAKIVFEKPTAALQPPQKSQTAQTFPEQRK